MQSSLRAIVLSVGVLLLIAAFAVFGTNGFHLATAVGPAALAGLGVSLLAIGFHMRRGGLWRRSGNEEHAAVGNDDLHRASVLQEERSASSSAQDAD